ncbi:MAG: RNA 3'-phosphate cyclase [Deferribacteres bacterium]|nr:RNA 3'-phosphate cyclase [Deferribacteres bacterium]
METIEIDGSFGEGGGQILRTALSLSCITGRALRLFNIRKGRKKPGLMPQHVTCVRAASEISGAKVSGAETGSTELMFTPREIRPGGYYFDIKTAGSSSLVLQTLLPPLVSAGGPSRITIKGGTHVPFSPCYDYISRVFLTMLDRLGVRVESSINRYGFYPKGGGEVSFKVLPAKEIKGLNITVKGKLLSASGYSGVANLPASIAERQKNSLIRTIAPLSADIRVMEVPSPGEGTFVFLKAEYEGAPAGFSSLGKRGKPAEEVGREAAEEFLDFHNTRACLDPYLSDQIVIYLSLAREKSSFTASRITRHLMTNLWVIEKFLDIRYQTEGDLNSEGRVDLYPAF